MRVEFFFKAQSELSTLVNFMMAYQQSSLSTTSTLASKVCLQTPTTTFSRFNLANKVKNDNLLVSAKNIINVMPAANVCVHYSLKYNTQKTVEQSFTYFNGFLSKAEEMGVAEILIVSGSGDKKALNTVSCLQMLRDSGSRSTNVGIAIAFNPYFPDPKMRSIEVDRLNAKLSTGMVSAIYLQFGSDISLLKEGLAAIQTALTTYENLEAAKDAKKIKVIGSVMIPSKVLLARMKFRPWNGVFLSEKFLGDVPTAETIVREMLETYRVFGVEPLVETAFKTDSDAAHILNLLSDQPVILNGPKEVTADTKSILTADSSRPVSELKSAAPKKRKSVH